MYRILAIDATKFSPYLQLYIWATFFPVISCFRGQICKSTAWIGYNGSTRIPLAIHCRIWHPSASKTTSRRVNPATCHPIWTVVSHPSASESLPRAHSHLWDAYPLNDCAYGLSYHYVHCTTEGCPHIAPNSVPRACARQTRLRFLEMTHLPGLVVRDLMMYRHIEGVDVRRREFSRRDPAFEKHVYLGERSSRRFRHAEVGVDDA